MTNPVDDLAAPLDALLVDAAFGPIRRLVPDLSVAKLVGRLARRPSSTVARLRDLAGELTRIGAGTSDLAPDRRDRRFADPAWSQNPILRRIMQTYLATGHTVEQCVADADLDWRDDQRVRFLAENLLQALAPTNLPLLNPESVKTAVDTAGLSLLRGGLNLAKDMIAAPRIPQMVDKSAFTVGANLGISPGAVVLRTDVFELVQYAPQTGNVRSVPLLMVPPTINKFYVLDLAPGRSWVEDIVRSGQQVFVLSWRNPDARHAGWGLDKYVGAVLDALDAVERIAASEQTVVTGICSGGILASLAAGYLTATGQADRLAGLGLGVSVLDQSQAGVPAAIADKYLAAAATRLSRRRGYLDGKALAEVFAWMRPGDLVWNYWVNNYLLGKKPPAFDVLYWNADTTRMPAALHADFVNLFQRNGIAEPSGLSVLGVPVDLSRVTTDAYVVAGIADHITPWQNCYRSTQLLGGKTRFVLSTSGHIAAMVNPPGNPKATYRVGTENPEEPQKWLEAAETLSGSWWPDFTAWLTARSGAEREAPAQLGGTGFAPLFDAPGTYVLDR